MEEEKKGFMKWVKAHKKALFIAGISIASIMGIIVAIKNKDSIVALRESLRKSIDKTPVKSVANSHDAVENIIHESVSVAETVAEAPIIQFPVGRNIQSTFDVSDHIRNLPNECHASAKKIATATEHGFKLKPGQTWVDGYTKSMMVA
ncbi:MAG: hypothetical protein QM644_12440 [Mobilitalea sp.]